MRVCFKVLIEFVCVHVLIGWICRPRLILFESVLCFVETIEWMGGEKTWLDS